MKIYSFLSFVIDSNLYFYKVTHFQCDIKGKFSNRRHGKFSGRIFCEFGWRSRLWSFEYRNIVWCLYLGVWCSCADALYRNCVFKREVLRTAAVEHLQCCHMVACLCRQLTRMQNIFRLWNFMLYAILERHGDFGSLLNILTEEYVEFGKFSIAGNYI